MRYLCQVRYDGGSCGSKSGHGFEPSIGDGMYLSTQIVWHHAKNREHHPYHSHDDVSFPLPDMCLGFLANDESYDTRNEGYDG